eukprot:1136993-Pelagomonas_calceolata.AAC.4
MLVAVLQSNYLSFLDERYHLQRSKRKGSTAMHKMRQESVAWEQSHAPRQGRSHLHGSTWEGSNAMHKTRQSCPHWEVPPSLEWSPTWARTGNTCQVVLCLLAPGACPQVRHGSSALLLKSFYAFYPNVAAAAAAAAGGHYRPAPTPCLLPASRGKRQVPPFLNGRSRAECLQH